MKQSMYKYMSSMYLYSFIFGYRLSMLSKYIIWILC